MGGGGATDECTVLYQSHSKRASWMSLFASPLFFDRCTYFASLCVSFVLSMEQ